jgi:WD40 repeat protein
MPTNPDIIATRTTMGPIYIFDRTKHTSTPSSDGICRPDLKLVGHTMEGYGMSWHGKREGVLVTASEDTTIHLWDITKTTTDKTMSSTRIFRGHSAWVEDVAFSPLVDYVFGSVGDDKMLMVWDERSDKGPMVKVEAHGNEINCLSFNPKNEYVLATGSADKVIKGD